MIDDARIGRREHVNADGAQFLHRAVNCWHMSVEATGYSCTYHAKLLASVDILPNERAGMKRSALPIVLRPRFTIRCENGLPSRTHRVHTASTQSGCVLLASFSQLPAASWT